MSNPMKQPVVANVTSDPNIKNEPKASAYLALMKRIEAEFARRSGLTKDASGNYSIAYTSLNGPLRVSSAWDSSEFYPTNFSDADVSNVDGTTLTSEQATFIISKILEICDVEGTTKIPSIKPKNNSHTISYTSINSVLSNPKLAGIIPQLFNVTTLNSIITKLAGEEYTSPTSSCRTSCTGLCYGACATSCSNACGEGCAGSCTGTCDGSCNLTCTNNCKLNCAENCGTDCSNLCTTSCNNACSNSCNDACTGECLGSCAATCNTSCYTSCTGTCNETCEGGCGGTSCGTDCRNGCKTGCKTSCTNSCGNNCTDNCKSNCSTGCNTTCKGQASVSVKYDY